MKKPKIPLNLTFDDQAEELETLMLEADAFTTPGAEVHPATQIVYQMIRELADQMVTRGGEAATYAQEVKDYMDAL